MTYPGTLGALQLMWDAGINTRTAFQEAKHLYLAYGEASFAHAMKMKVECHCPQDRRGHVKWHDREGRMLSDGCQDYRFWSAVELILDCHRYVDSTGVAS